MERRINRRRQHLGHASLLGHQQPIAPPTVTLLATTSSAGYYPQRSQSVKDLPGAHEESQSFRDMFKDSDAVSRWTSQILAQIDSLPNLETVGLDDHQQDPIGTFRSQLAAPVASSTANKFSKSVVSAILR